LPGNCSTTHILCEPYTLDICRYRTRHRRRHHCRHHHHGRHRRRHAAVAVDSTMNTGRRNKSRTLPRQRCTLCSCLPRGHYLSCAPNSQPRHNTVLPTRTRRSRLYPGSGHCRCLCGRYKSPYRRRRTLLPRNKSRSGTAGRTHRHHRRRRRRCRRCRRCLRTLSSCLLGHRPRSTC
jgi:hypothetical protein